MKTEQAKQKLLKMFPTITFGRDADGPVILRKGKVMYVLTFKWDNVDIPPNSTIYVYQSSGEYVRYAIG